MDPRTLTIPGQWAADAQTIIPAPPIPGVAYRNPALDAAAMRAGQQYSRIADSAQWNQLHYLTTGMAAEVEGYGIPRYSPLTNYYASAFCLSLDGVLMQAIQPSGPANGGAHPTTDSAYWKVAIDLNKSLVRTKIFSPQTFYIRTDGNNNNTGLENTPEGALRDWNGLVAKALSIDFNTQAVNVVYGPGVFTYSAHWCTFSIFAGAIDIYITGDSSSETIFQPPSSVNEGPSFSAAEGIFMHVSNVTVDVSQQPASRVCYPFIAQRGSGIRLNGRIKIIGSASSDLLNLNFQGIAAYHGALIEIYTGCNLTITGNWRYTIHPRYCSAAVFYSGGLSLNVNSTFEIFVLLDDLSSMVYGSGVSHSGTAHGIKYTASWNCGINTYGQGVNVLPGDVAGVLRAGAYYV